MSSEENIQQENIQQERIDKELILKQWIIENPDKAKIWYAHYSGSTKCDDFGINSFLNQLGRGSDVDFWANGYWNGYTTWEMWLDAYEAYCEFKSKAPEKWRQLKEAKYRVYIHDAAQELLRYSIGHKHATFAAHKILSKWINHNQELWKEITSKYSSAIKSNEDYLLQAWLETFQWNDAFSVWKIKDPILWKQFQIKCDAGTIVEESVLRSVWIETHKNKWEEWKLLQSELWKQFYESHKKFLWYAYTEIEWSKHLKEKKAKEEEERAKLQEQERTYETEEYYEIPEEEWVELVDFEDVTWDWDTEILHEEKYKYLENSDPRFEYKCKTNADEDRIHAPLIDRYEEELRENPEKSLFIQNCSEYNFDAFVKRTRKERKRFDVWNTINIPVEESPEEFADRKMMEQWIVRHQTQWNKWKYRYCWAKEYNKCSYSTEEYYDAWKQLKANKWKKWINANFEKWKQEAQDIDLWFAWLSDDNELAFHQWASSHLKSWEHYIDRSMQSDCDFAYSRLFCSPTLDFKDWRENNFEEWNYWKEIIKEEILIDEFSHSNLSLPYCPEYKLQIQIKEKLYRHRIGQKIFYNHLAIICDNDKYGYINENGEIVIPLKFDYANNFCDGLALVKVNCKQMPFCGKYTSGKTFIDTMKSGGQCGVINTRGEYVVKPQYDYLSSFNRGIAVFEIEGKLKKITHGDVWWYRYRDGKHGAINKRGEVVIQPVFDGLIQLENGVFIAKDHNSKKWGLLSNNTAIVGSYDVIRVLNNGLYKVNIGLNYKVVLNAFNETVFDDYEEGRWGLLSVTGKQLTPLKYTHISNFHNGRALVNVNSQYDQLSGWSCIGGLWGYINEKGEEVMPLIACSTYDEFLDCVTYLDYLDSLDAMAKEQSLDYNQYENWLIEQEILEEEKMEKEYQKIEDEYYSNRKQRDTMSRIRKEKNLPNLFDL